MSLIDVNSQWYPYQKVQGSYYDLRNAVQIPKMICDYLIDAPKGDYTPKDDERYCRSRLWKYLFYDGENPLSNPLPTIEQKMSVLFNPDKPTTPPTDKGYRLIPQVYIKQSQEEAQTRLYIYMGRTVPSQDQSGLSVSVVFDIFTHYTYELNTRTDEYSRCFAIEQCLIEAFHGVYFDGNAMVGTFYYNKTKHPDCGSKTIYDGNTNIGRELIMAFDLKTTDVPEMEQTVNMPRIGNNITMW